MGWFVLQLPTCCSFRVGRSCALWAPSLPQASCGKEKSLLLLPLQCTAPGTSGLHGACALPLVGEATGIGPAPANPPSLVGTPARAQRSKPSSATSLSAQVGTVTDLKPPLQQVSPARCPTHGSSRSVADSSEILNYPKEDAEERIHSPRGVFWGCSAQRVLRFRFALCDLLQRTPYMDWIWLPLLFPRPS